MVCMLDEYSCQYSWQEQFPLRNPSEDKRLQKMGGWILELQNSLQWYLEFRSQLGNVA